MCRRRFSEIKRTIERKGPRSQFNHSEMQDFSEFIEDMNLVDLPTLGNKFTYFNVDEDSMNCLDRFLISEGLIDK